MPVEANISPQGDSANTHSQPRLTPGSQPWKAAVIRDMREGYGVEDIALRLDCRTDAVRDFVQTMRRLGPLPRLYAEARCAWREARA